MVQCTRAPPAFLILFIYLETENNINKVGAAPRVLSMQFACRMGENEIINVINKLS